LTYEAAEAVSQRANDKSHLGNNVL
jgi:hypothetical protein